MMRTILVAALSLTACTANPAAHIRLMAANTPPQEDSYIAPVVVEERQEPAMTIVALRITPAPDPEPATVGDEPPIASTEDVPPPAPEEPGTPEEIEPELQDDPVVEAPVNPHPACRRATPAAFC